MLNITKLEVAQLGYKLKEPGSRAHTLYYMVAAILTTLLHKYKTKTEKKHILPTIDKSDSISMSSS